MSRWLLALAALAVVVQPGQPRAWEAATTHAGLAERAALASRLHSRIENDLGVSGGLFSRLVVPPADAPSLLKLLRKFNPTHGYVPDTRGRQLALSWLAAGAALANSPTRFAGNHFLDPDTKKGLDRHTIDTFGERSRHYLGHKSSGERMVDRGKPAHLWIEDKANPLGHSGFVDQYHRAASARTAGERDRHLAGALIAAGAILHVVQDMASPSHVHIDLRAHLDELGKSSTDVGSRLERIAALAFGRLGVPAATKVVRKDRLAEFFVAADGSGLAQRVAARFYSRYTVPTVPRLPRGAGALEAAVAVRKALGRSDLKIQPANRGYRVVDPTGTCVVLFDISARDVNFYLDDPCVLQQLRTLLPLAAGYGAGVLDYLFRGQIEVKLDPTLSLSPAVELGDGELTLYWDDPTGVRTKFHSAKVRGKLPGTLPKPPSGAAMLIALYKRSDKLGEPLVAVGSAVPPE
ncbi:MAG: hypothetical protein KJO07_22040 [Deltaproteobacteria bacterium]|nr:hypothetical protein [Deltaproteobacteria bacterium]